jgi:chromosomal replication initiation ATPase DnaA
VNNFRGPACAAVANFTSTMKDLTTSWSAWMPEPFVPTTSNTAAFEQAMDFIRRPQPTGTLVISGAVGNGATHLALVLRQEYIGLKPEATVWMQSYERAASDLERNIPLPSGLDLAVIDGWAPAVHRSGGQLLAEVHHRLARCLIITCSDEVALPFTHHRIHLPPLDTAARCQLSEWFIKREIPGLPNDLVQHIGSLPFLSIRELEGFIISLGANAALSGEPLDRQRIDSYHESCVHAQRMQSEPG